MRFNVVWEFMKKNKSFMRLLFLHLGGEIVFSLFAFHSLSIYVILFAILNSYFMLLLFNLIRRKWSLYLYIGFNILYLISNYIYFSYYHSYLNVNLIFNLKDITSFASNLPSMLLKNWYFILIILALGVLAILFIHRIIFVKNSYKSYWSLPLLYIFILITILVVPNAKDVYFYGAVNAKTMQKFGVGTSIRLDIQRLIFGVNEKKTYIKANNKHYALEDYNILEIDFKDSDNEDIKEINNYLKNREPTNKNEMTSFLEGKNLIFILAESFHSIAIDEKLTPNLYRLKNEGFTFENYYNPLYPVATADAQFVYDSSLLPKGGTNTLVESNNNYFPYSIASIFNDMGYNTYSYHDYTYNYYSRDKYYLNMGFDVYKGVGNGLNINTKKGYSDLEMVQNSINDYIKDDKFFTYYLTMSGHYAYDSNNKIGKKNISLLKDYNYSNASKVYMSTQIELDKMIGYLLETLDKNNRLDDTVIFLVPDHYPHGLTTDEINELSSYERDEVFEAYHSDFIIYNKKINSLKDSQKYCSDIDVLPTLLNLFGIKYDSRLLFGKDIFSDSEEPVTLGDRSIIGKDFKYNSFNEKIVGSANRSYIKNLKERANSEYRISRLIIENDYYRYLFDK